MYSERLQVLLSTEQRRLLDEESRRTGLSAAALIRDAIEARYGAAGAPERRAAVARMRQRTAPAPQPAELRDMLAERFDDEAATAR